MNEAELAKIEVTEVCVIDDDTYKEAIDALKEVKRRIDAVKEYWAKPKKTAHDAHKEIVAKEKSMLHPLEKLETSIRNSVRDYLERKEEERKKQEEEYRIAINEEAMRYITEGGDMETATMMVEVDMPKSEEEIEGISTRKTWKARVVDASKVPSYFNGEEIRTIDIPALNRIARTSSGSAKIEGVDFYQESTIAVNK